MSFMDINAGVRYEYAKTQTRQSSEDVTYTNDINRHFSDFFPNITLSITKPGNFEFDLSYARRIIRPNYRELDPGIYYEDSLSYTSGNPFLKPTYDNDLLFRVSYKNQLSFSFNYLKTKDAILQTYVEEEEKPDVLKMIPINIPKSRSFNLNTMFNHEAKDWNFNCDFGINIPHLKIPTSEGVHLINKLSWDCSANLDWTFAKYFTAYTNFSYSSSSYSLVTYQFAYNNLTIGLLARLADNKLNIDLSGTDILDGSNWNNWDERYLNVVTRMRGNYDMRGVKLSISYLFNGNPGSLKSQRGNISPLRRTN
ncbi:MAG: outer membrane beta-barrel family protein [Tannerellaceae bacterium]|nr:outer membrane beta-barrel family protein [Tannerellaceae bacterium]MCD7712288.1 outer membrane beta-barrel family protein [Bacillota bacterium]